MKLPKKIILGLTGLILHSCSPSSDPGKLEDIAVSFRATIAQQTIQWQESHAAGVYVKKNGAALGAAAAEMASNTKYLPSADGMFHATPAASALSAGDARADIIAYFPFRHVVEDYSLPVNLADQSNQAALDLMYSDNVRGVSLSSETTPALDFTHRLSKVILQVRTEKEISGPWEAKMEGVADRAVFDLITGALTDKQNSAEGIRFKTTRTENTLFAEAILLPQDGTSSVFLSFTIGNETHRLTLSDYTSLLESGKVYILSADISKNSAPKPDGMTRNWEETPDNTMPLWEEKDGYRLVWEDQFSGTSLNEKAWNIELVENPQNNEFQAYKKENIRIGKEPLSGNSCLILTARKESHGNRHFTSGRLNTMKKVAFRYGRIDARIKLPKTANGLWPAFWMKGNDNDVASWPSCGEIDILEMGHTTGIAAGTQDRYLGAACHWGPNNAGLRSESHKTTFPYSLQDDDFHTYTLIWDKDFITMYVDLDRFPNQAPHYRFNHRTNAQNAVTYFNKEFYVLLNLAVGGSYTGITGSGNIDQVTGLNAGNNYEASMYVDYIRIYQKGESNEKMIRP